MRPRNFATTQSSILETNTKKPTRVSLIAGDVVTPRSGVAEQNKEYLPYPEFLPYDFY